MQTMPREHWTDERLDEFGKRMDERFDRTDERIKATRLEMKEGFEQVDKRLEKISDGLESMQRALVLGVIALSSAYMAGFAALVTQI